MRLKVFISGKYENMSCPMAKDFSNERTGCHIPGTRHTYYPRRIVLWAVLLCTECQSAEHFRINKKYF